MTPKEEFEKLMRKEVRELLKRQIYFSREVMSFARENFELKERLAEQGLKLIKLQTQLQELATLLETRKKS